jgi:hypothetical protein
LDWAQRGIAEQDAVITIFYHSEPHRPKFTRERAFVKRIIPAVLQYFPDRDWKYRDLRRTTKINLFA